MKVVHFGMQGEDIIEHSNGKCYLRISSPCKRKIFLRYTNAKLVICLLYFQSTCKPLCNVGIHLITLLNTHKARYVLVSTSLERQVSWDDTNGEVVDD